MILFFLACLCTTAFAQEKGTLTDSRDSKTYKWVKIGEQVWMAENLNYKAEGSRCYGEDGKVEVDLSDNDYLYKTLSGTEIQANCEKYGRLYNWATAMALPDSCNKRSCSSQIQSKHRGICPAGWYLPSNAEWDALLWFVDGTSGTDSPYWSKTAGKLLKAANGWNNNKRKSGNSTDDYGFSALPGGGYYITYGEGNFGSAGNKGEWQSASEYKVYNAYGRFMFYNRDDAGHLISDKFSEVSVRCLRD